MRFRLKKEIRIIFEIIKANKKNIVSDAQYICSRVKISKQYFYKIIKVLIFEKKIDFSFYKKETAFKYPTKIFFINIKNKKKTMLNLKGIILPQIRKEVAKQCGAEPKQINKMKFDVFCNEGVYELSLNDKEPARNKIADLSEFYETLELYINSKIEAKQILRIVFEIDYLTKKTPFKIYFISKNNEQKFINGEDLF